MIAPLHVAPVAYLIITAVFMVSVFALRNRPFFEACRMHPYALYRGKRLATVVTSLFVHVGWLHLLLNTAFLVIYLPEVEFMLRDDFGSLAGSLLLVPAVLFIGWFAAGCDALQRRKDKWHRSAGCSHVVFGIMVLYFVYFPVDDEGGEPTLLPSIPGVAIAAVLLVLLLFFVLVNQASAAPIHFYGALAGLILACVIRPEWIGETLGAVRAAHVSEKGGDKSERTDEQGTDHAVSGPPGKSAFAAFAALDGVRLIGVQAVHPLGDG